jgi:predicted nucleotidyltransferase component of viral defense system
MSKRVLSAEEQYSLREMLQTATIAALMDSRRWAPGDIAFQGGTSLHLAHGSTRFSEDLDFMVRGGLSLKNLSSLVEKKLRLPADTPADLTLTVSVSKDDRNPHIFYVTLSGPQVLGSAKVKIELWQTPDAALKSLQLKIATVASTAGQAFVPTLTLDEIFADKVYALGARERIKPRDIFDLAWLREKKATRPTINALQTRLEIYPSNKGNVIDTATNWLINANKRLAELKASNAPKNSATDLKRWLPSSWPMDEAAAAIMLKTAIAELDHAMKIMDKFIALSPETHETFETPATAKQKGARKKISVKIA